jgi:hypothetical protein
MYRSKVVALTMAKIMKLTYTDLSDGMVIIGFTDERGEHEIALSTIETADLIGAFQRSSRFTSRLWGVSFLLLASH